MKWLFVVFAVVATTVTSCQKEFTDKNTSVGEIVINEHMPSYAISEDEALERLDNFMTAFDNAETRVRHRTIKKIEKISLNNISNHTRSTLSSDDIRDLLYIVEFGEGEGSAILGADNRTEQVYAVLDNTVLTADDFKNALNGENKEDISTFIASAIATSAMNSNYTLTSSILPPPSGGGGLNTEMYNDIEQHTLDRHITPLLDTKWGQTSFYNGKFPTSYGIYADDRQCAGCSTIALAQILNNNLYPNPIELNDNLHYWSNICHFRWNNTNLSDSTYIASYIFDLSEELESRYYDNGSTGASMDDVKRVMKKLGYSDLSVGGITETRILPMLESNKAVFAGGYRNENLSEGHAWVIDGWKAIRTDYIHIIYNGFGIEKSRDTTQTVVKKYVHCNMGYEGRCDGYYTLNIFNISVNKNGDDVEIECGDQSNTGYKDTLGNDIIFRYGLQTLTYNY